jgi:hypothetical protein
VPPIVVEAPPIVVEVPPLPPPDAPDDPPPLPCVVPPSEAPPLPVELSLSLLLQPATRAATPITILAQAPTGLVMKGSPRLKSMCTRRKRWHEE